MELVMTKRVLAAMLQAAREEGREEGRLHRCQEDAGTGGPRQRAAMALYKLVGDAIAAGRTEGFMADAQAAVDRILDAVASEK